jgi:O-antigen/teichoic acid export membrane protein
VVSGVTAAQTLVQLTTALVGFLLLRWLSVAEFAQYTVATGFITTLSILVDLGTDNAVIALVGERRTDPEVIAKYIGAARSLRTTLLAGTIPVSGFAFFLITRSHGWGARGQLLLFASVVATVVGRVSFDLYSAPLLIQRRFGAFYAPQIRTSLLRLAASAALHSVGILTAWLATAVTALAFMLNGRAFRRSASLTPVSDIRPGDLATHRKEILSYLAPLAFGAIFFAFQSQISVFLIATFGDVRSIADTGALGRLGQIFAFASALSPTLIGPHVASLSRPRLARRYTEIIVAAHLFGAGAVLAGFLFPKTILLLLGSNYGHLENALRWFLAASAMSYVGSVIYTMNLARRFVWWRGSLLGPAVVIIVQAIGVATLDLATPVGVQQLATISAAAVLVVSYASIAYGFSRPPADRREVLTFGRESTDATRDAYERAVCDYIVTACGGSAPPGLIQGALAGAADCSRADPERIRDAARSAALAEAGRSARRIGPRLRHFAHGRFGHAKVPEFLRRRAAGLLAPADLYWLYDALATCPDCGSLAARINAAEWRFNLAVKRLAPETAGGAASTPRADLSEFLPGTPVPGSVLRAAHRSGAVSTSREGPSAEPSRLGVATETQTPGRGANRSSEHHSRTRRLRVTLVVLAVLSVGCGAAFALRYVDAGRIARAPRSAAPLHSNGVLGVTPAPSAPPRALQAPRPRAARNLSFLIIG